MSALVLRICLYICLLLPFEMGLSLDSPGWPQALSSPLIQLPEC